MQMFAQDADIAAAQKLSIVMNLGCAMDESVMQSIKNHPIIIMLIIALFGTAVHFESRT